MIISKNTQKIIKNPSKRWAFIRHELLKIDLNLSILAKEKGVNPKSVHKVRHSSNPKIENWIAEKLGMEAHQLFPDRYDNDNLPLSFNKGHDNENT